MATFTGRRIVEMVWEDLTPGKIISAAAVDNAITTVLALAGSTNAVVHLLAMAHRAGIPLTLDRFDELARRTPVLANMRPAGKYLMEDFYYAGGLPALLKALGDLLDTSALTVSGKTLGVEIDGAQIFNPDVIHTRDNPLVKSDALVVLRGNLAPDGAVLKPPAAEAHLLKHKGPAVVFDSYEEMKKRMDDPDLNADESSVFILRNAGPKGGPGMPEWGQLPVPKKLLQKGVRDVLRISDSRMSGTSYGACVLHVAPEAAVGGPLALVKEGDIIEMDVAARKLNMLVSDEELAKRRAAWKPPQVQFQRGYGQMFLAHIKQANEGCDFDFLEGTAKIPDPAIY
jgi:dihydroxy-acid dehydratase